MAIVSAETSLSGCTHAHGPQLYPLLPGGIMRHVGHIPPRLPEEEEAIVGWDFLTSALIQTIKLKYSKAISL